MPQFLVAIHHPDNYAPSMEDEAMMKTTPSPIVALNRAVAVGMAQGPAAGLDALDAIAMLAAHSAQAGYHLLHSVRGDLLMKMRRFTEAREEIQRAITMTQNLREQELLTERLKQIEKAALSA
jgi:RNA polymerase sigma-70 factor, ECF subfamily